MATSKVKVAIDFADSALEEHMRFICPECGADHCSQQDWRRHLNEKHNYERKSVADFDFKEINDRYHECLVCHTWVANAHQAIALLQYHRFLHLPYSRTYRCRHCCRAFTRKRALCEHLFRFHARLLDQINTGKAAMEENPEFFIRFLCPQCGKIMARFEQWLQHLEQSHQMTSSDLRMNRIMGTRNHYCLICKKLLYTSDKAKLQRHRFTHLPYKYYFQCSYCSVKKQYKADVLRHFIQVHNAEFMANKHRVQIPQEWGAPMSERLIEELSKLMLMDNSDKNSKKISPQCTDLIQKALIDSLIDLEKESEDVEANKQQKSANEIALDQSLLDLEAVLRSSDLAKSKEEEFDALCEEIFEADVKIEIKCEDDIKQESSNSLTQRTAADYCEEQIICIEIDALDNESAQKVAAQAYHLSPKRKRIKLDNSDAECDTKSENDRLQTLLEAHIKYLCPECGKEFTEQEAWRTHVFVEHNLGNVVHTNFKPLQDKSAYLCLDCLRVQYTTKHAELQRHRFQHLPYQAYLKCTLCGTNKSSKPKMLQHLRETHTRLLEQKLHAIEWKQNFRCADCGKEFRTQTQWQNHRGQCLQRSLPVTRNYNIAHNLKLLQHLKTARKRIRQIAAEIAKASETG